MSLEGAKKVYSYLQPEGEQVIDFEATFTNVQDAPEPATLAVLGLGLLGLGFAVRRRNAS